MTTDQRYPRHQVKSAKVCYVQSFLKLETNSHVPIDQVPDGA